MSVLVAILAGTAVLCACAGLGLAPGRWRGLTPPSPAAGRSADRRFRLPAWLRFYCRLPPAPQPLASDSAWFQTVLDLGGLGAAVEGRELACREPWLALLGAVGALVLGLAGAVPGPLGMAALLATGGVGLPLWCRRRLAAEASRRQRALLRELPALVDVLVLALESGLTVRQTLAVAGRHAPVSWRPLFERLSAQVGHGSSLEHAAANVRPSVAPGPGRAVLRALVAAERAGVGQVQVLRRQAHHARALVERRWQARLNALPVQLMVIGMLFLFPPVVVVLLLPNVLAFVGRW